MDAFNNARPLWNNKLANVKASHSPDTGLNPCSKYYTNGVGLYWKRAINRLSSGSLRAPVVRGKKHLFSYTRHFMNPFFSRWKVNEVTFCKSMEVTDLGRERIDICRKCPFYSLGFCVMCSETMVLKVSIEDMECPQGRWDSDGHI